MRRTRHTSDSRLFFDWLEIAARDLLAAGVLPDVHNLTWLCKQVAKFDASFRPYIQHTAGLNRLYIETRYPSDNGLHLSAETVGAVYEFAQTVYTQICDEIYDAVDVEED